MKNRALELLLDMVAWEDCARPVNNGDNLPYPTHKGILHVGGSGLRCYQLNTGERIIDADDMEAFFRAETNDISIHRGMEKLAGVK